MHHEYTVEVQEKLQVLRDLVADLREECAEKDDQIEALSDLARFMCSVWHRSEKFIYEHCDGDALMKYPVIQGTGNQINLMKIGTQPYSQDGVKAAVELLKGK